MADDLTNLAHRLSALADGLAGKAMQDVITTVLVEVKKGASGP